MDDKVKLGDARLSGLVTPAEVADYLGIPIQTLAQWRWRNEGPAYVRVGRLIRYRKEDLLSFVEASRQETVAR